jgi:endonuclease/exonuclease/phosphatase family metal-dependent hydrolase
MHNSSLAGVLLAVGLIAFQATADATPIIIDGDFADWAEVTPVYADASGDQVTGDIDFGRLWVANDEKYILLSLELGTEINLQGGNQITLYIDLDNNERTGTPVHDIGAELEWTFGRRRGQLKDGLLGRPVYHDDLGLVCAPTVTSDRFEIAIEKHAGSVSYRRIFRELVCRLVIVDRAGGDHIPDARQSITIRLDRSPPETLPPLTLSRHDRDHLRIMTYNVLWDGLFDDERDDAFGRVLRAIRPDIIGFQEVFTHNAEQTTIFVRGALPFLSLIGFGRWYGSKPDPESDIVLVSRFPILETFAIGMNGAFLIDLTPWYDTDLLVVVAHPPCCGNNIGRQWEIDALMAFIRDAKEPGGTLDLKEGTPIIVMGDMNLVGDSQQRKTLLTGDIIHTDVHGSGFAPDWDGSDFADLVPRQTHLPMAFTWYSALEYFWPGRLDYIVCSDAAVDVGNNFVLFTPAMPKDELSRYRLRADDTTTASDHLPVVCDLILPTAGVE